MEIIKGDKKWLSGTGINLRSGRSSEVEHSLMVQWVVGSILHELFLIPASAP